MPFTFDADNADEAAILELCAKNEERMEKLRGMIIVPQFPNGVHVHINRPERVLEFILDNIAPREARLEFERGIALEIADALDNAETGVTRLKWGAGLTETEAARLTVPTPGG